MYTALGKIWAYSFLYPEIPKEMVGISTENTLQQYFDPSNQI